MEKVVEYVYFVYLNFDECRILCRDSSPGDLNEDYVKSNIPP